MNSKRPRLIPMRQPGWVRKILVDQASRKVSFQYYFKRNPAPHLELKTPIARKLAGYALIERDLLSVKKWLELGNSMDPRNEKDPSPGFHLITDSHENDELVRALFLAAVTFYGKCFTKADGRRVKLERENVPEELAGTHDELMNLRHNFASHSGELGFESCIVNLIFDPRKKHQDKNAFLQQEIVQTFSSFSDPSNENGYLALIAHQLSWVQSKMKALSDQVINREVLPKGIGYWLERSRRT